MRVTDKRLTHFLFPVTVLTLCGFLRFPGWKWKFNWGRCKRPFRTCVLFRVLLSRDLSRLPQLECLLAGYVLPSQFVDDSYTWVIRLSLSLSNGLPVNGVKQFVFVLFSRYWRFSRITMTWKSDIEATGEVSFQMHFFFYFSYSRALRFLNWSRR